jgi:hypothetical protein
MAIRSNSRSLGRAAPLFRRQLLANLAAIEAAPTDMTLRQEFLARNDILWDKMRPADQEAVTLEHDRVRAAISPKKRAPARKRRLRRQHNWCGVTLPRVLRRKCP